ncbi:MAG: metallophosphoesterase family protein [Candidatus Heimdallarchaeota archaeon]|nr:MAG: metallophosphoesterase family protein [Candidatus Heimdallarchaeota archaeon]
MDRKLLIIPIIIGVLISGVFLLIILSDLLTEEPVEEIKIPSKITRGPFLSMVTQNSIYVSWWTDEPGNSTVRYGTDLLMDVSVFNGTDVEKHEIKLDNLIFNSSYFYQVQTANFSSEIYTFKTAPGFSVPVKFIFHGDNRGEFYTTEIPEKFKQILKNMNASQPDLVFAVGDLIANDGIYEKDFKFLQKQWDTYFKVINNYTHEIPWIYAIGNHDAPLNHNESSFTDVVVQPKTPDKLERYFSFDYGPVHFIILDTERNGGNTYEIVGEQWNWLVEDLSSPRQAIHTLIIMHKPLTSPYVPPYWTNQRGLFAREETGALFQELCENYSVTAIICSHDHMYHRDQIGSHNLTQIVTAGAGAPLYVSYENLGGFHHHTELEINWKDIQVKLVKDNGTVMEDFMLETPYDLDFPNKPKISGITFSSLDCNTGNTIDIEATIEGMSLDAKLYYSFDGLNWYNQTLTPLGQNYSGSIECTEATEIGQFYVDIKDDTNNRTVSDLYSFIVDGSTLPKEIETATSQYLIPQIPVDSGEKTTYTNYETKMYVDSLILIELIIKRGY